MIKLTRLNGETFYLNYFQILSLESIPETKIRMTNGDFFLVRESIDHIVKETQVYFRSIFTGDSGMEQ
ncbi:flagellar FlbD family protein [Lachnospiraceae bacterium YH-ros2226]|jgi:flagellar protein FlbD|nr:flagellar FlbD family protein [Lachnospiraceae bacterium]MDD6449784.1 flagellar FlbD family protein [Lachnospiraceae bacterium]MDD6578947.1 flagellar FlbD family protein [Lachnospiraceae bacterium]